MIIKLLKNDVHKEEKFENVEEAKAYYLIPEEQIKELIDDYTGNDFEYNKKMTLQREQDIKDAKDLEELANVLNDYTDNFGDGSTWSVEVIGSNVKYELRKKSVEILYKDRNDIVEGVTSAFDECDSELITTFGEFDLNEAKNKLSEYKTNIRELSGNAGTYYLVEEYYIEENEYDEDDEWVTGGDIVEFSKINIELVEKPSYEVLGKFDNMEEAENAYNEYDGDYEVYLSF